MSTTTYSTLRGHKVIVQNDHFGKGGEGKIHSISSSRIYTNHCAKIFIVSKASSKNKEQQKLRDYRIKYMILNPPTQLEDQTIKICWPVDAILKQNTIIGFIMPLAFNNSKLLYELCLPKLNKNISAKWRNVYQRSSKKGMISRLKLCTNISLAVHRIHNTSGYIFVDLKPQNLLVTAEGRVSVIDCDSIQISEKGKVFFHSSVATEEYIPPEGKNINTRTDTISESWDLFSLSVIFYQILFGIHPYAISFVGMNENNNNWNYRIQNSYFAHGKKKSEILVTPELHNNYKLLPSSIKVLFERSFSNETYNLRPRASEWGSEFYKNIKSDYWLKSGFNSTIKAPKKKTTKELYKNDQPQDVISSALKIPKEYEWWKPAMGFLIWIIIIILIA